MLRNLSENPVPSLARLIDITRFQGKSQPLGGSIGLMNREVAPPNAPIIPKVMIGILLVNSKRELGFAFHAF